MSRGLGYSPAEAAEFHTPQRQQNWLVGFEDRYAERQRLARRERIRKAEQRSRRDDRELDFDAAIFARQNAEQRELVQRRLAEGYIQWMPREIGGRFRSDVREMGLRSENNPVLKYFVSLVPKGGKARASWDKAHLEVQCRQKILTLDFPYIELVREFLAALRVDCDGVFLSPEACIAALLELVRDGRIPCLPHIVVGDRLDDGRYSRPHFIWLLPQGSAVWRSDDKRCRTAPVKLFDAVARGLAAALLDLGADPAAPTMTGRMKCPLSPFWHTMTPNADIWPTLTEYANYVDTSTDRAVLTRKAAAVQSGLGLTASNAIFDTLRTEGQRLLAAWHFGADVRMRGSRAALADHLHEALAAFAASPGLSDERVSYVTGEVSRYLAAHFDVAKLEGPRRVRGRLAHVVDGMTSVAARQAAGGRHAAKANADRTIEKMCAAYRAMGGCVTKSALAEAAGVSRRTVGSRWSDMLAALDEGCAKQCIDKKVGTLPAAGEYQRSDVSSDAATVFPVAVRPTSIANGGKTAIGEAGETEGLRTRAATRARSSGFGKSVDGWSYPGRSWWWTETPSRRPSSPSSTWSVPGKMPRSGGRRAWRCHHGQRPEPRPEAKSPSGITEDTGMPRRREDGDKAPPGPAEGPPWNGPPEGADAYEVSCIRSIQLRKAVAPRSAGDEDSLTATEEVAMVLSTPELLRNRVRDLVYSKAEADGLGVQLMELVKADPRLGPLYTTWKEAQRKVLVLEAKTLGMVGGDVDLLERLIGDEGRRGGVPVRSH